MRRPEAPVRARRPTRSARCRADAVTRCSPVGSISASTTSPSWPVQGLPLRPAAGGRVDVPQHHLATLPDGGRPGPVRRQGDVPDGAPVGSEFLHAPRRPGRRASPRRRPRARRRRRAAPGSTRIGASRAGGATATWLPVARSTRVAPAVSSWLQRTADDPSSAKSAPSPPSAVGSEPATPVSRGAPPDGSIWTSRHDERAVPPSSGMATSTFTRRPSGVKASATGSPPSSAPLGTISTSPSPSASRSHGPLLARSRCRPSGRRWARRRRRATPSQPSDSDRSTRTPRRFPRGDVPPQDLRCPPR